MRYMWPSLHSIHMETKSLCSVQMNRCQLTFASKPDAVAAQQFLQHIVHSQKGRSDSKGAIASGTKQHRDSRQTVIHSSKNCLMVHRTGQITLSLCEACIVHTLYTAWVL